VLEPDTEGRLAAALARSGEGVAAIYLAPKPRDTAAAGGASPTERPQRIDPTRLGHPAPGPLGSGRLLLARPTWGPHVIVLDRPLPPRSP
jgi:hypothetical protein